MACFAKLNNDNVVERVETVVNDVITDENNIEQEALGIQFLKNLHGQDTNWKQSSYNTNSGVHALEGTPFRKNHGGRGYTYDESRDAFIPPKPFNPWEPSKTFDSWILNETTCQWEAPVPYPEVDVGTYDWNEDDQTWVGRTEERSHWFSENLVS
tara:strand:+ start:183 stop:647 length:465 start_codon:yes stop_codon:yes gene_type:complete